MTSNQEVENVVAVIMKDSCVGFVRSSLVTLQVCVIIRLLSLNRKHIDGMTLKLETLRCVKRT